MTFQQAPPLKFPKRCPQSHGCPTSSALATRSGLIARSNFPAIRCAGMLASSSLESRFFDFKRRFRT
jgi:hypothetical protein